MTGDDMSGNDKKAETLTGDVHAGPGGAMTDEVGVVTGDLTVATVREAGDRARIAVQYTGADEWYTLTGSPATVPPGGLAALHAEVLRSVERGGGAVSP
ncbi:hypothetical protein ACIRL3_24410 [Streptomyces sp. NPDC102384]|uniref:hypothetical protein n=1 Tax=unclassified Streptomyces TaxID=2593676 RepID=UPI00380F552A